MQCMELAAFKWNSSGTDIVTYNLALWTIHMLAVVSRDVKTYYDSISDDPDYTICYRSRADS